MIRRAKGDQGVTLIELLLATTIMVLVVGATFTAVVVGTKNTTDTRTRLDESHDTQLVETRLPQDLQNATSSFTCAAPTLSCSPQGDPSGCTGTTGNNLVTLRWSETNAGTTTNYSVSYRVVPTASETQLVRYACTGAVSPPNTAAGWLVVAHNLASSQSQPPSTCGSRLSVTIVEKTGYSYTVSGDSRVGFTGVTSVCPGNTTTIPPVHSPPPGYDPRGRLTEFDMFDDNQDGRLDRFLVLFNGTIPSSCNVASYWTLTNAPAGMSISNVQVTGNGKQMTLTLSGAAVDTGAPSMTASFNPTGSCGASPSGLQPFANEHPDDFAAPIVTAVTSVQKSGGVVGKIETGDSLVVSFSESLPFTTTTVTVQETKANGNNPTMLTIPSVTNGALSIGTGYFSGNSGASVSFAATVSASGNDLTTLLTGTCTGADCSRVQAPPANANPSFVYVAATTLADASGNLVVATTLPGNGFKAF